MKIIKINTISTLLTLLIMGFAQNGLVTFGGWILLLIEFMIFVWQFDRLEGGYGR